MSEEGDGNTNNNSALQQMEAMQKLMDTQMKMMQMQLQQQQNIANNSNTNNNNSNTNTNNNDGTMEGPCLPPL